MTRNYFFIFIIMLGTFSCSIEKPLIVIPGVGAEKFKVDTIIKTVLSSLGNDYDYYQETPNCDDCSNTNLYYYHELGVVITTKVDMYQLDSQDIDHAVVRNIIFIKSATTTNSLVLGKDTKAKIISIYGNPNDDYGSDSTMTYLHYNDRGISFGVDKKDNKIRIIDIYNINGFSENLSLNTINFLFESKK